MRRLESKSPFTCQTRRLKTVNAVAVTVESHPLQPVGLMWTDASFDEARQHMADVAILLAQLGEAESALWRLLNEQRKTQERVNALNYNVIPRYKNTISYIESALSEEERSTILQLKVMREKLAVTNW